MLERCYYQEVWEYKWSKVRKPPVNIDIPAVKSLKSFPADWAENGELVYALDEKQCYRAKHKKYLKLVREEIN
jgi:hypothetical protein